MPSVEAVLLLLLAALLLMGSPGPATMSLAATGAAFGVRRGVPHLLGIVLGTTAVLLLVATGVTGLVLSLPGAAPLVTALAAAYILYLAWCIAAAPPPAEARGAARRPSLLGGLVLATANPKAYAAIGAVYSSTMLVADRPFLDGAAKVAVLSGVIVVVSAAWLALGTSMAALLRRPRTGRLVNVAFAVLLVASFVLSVVM